MERLMRKTTLWALAGIVAFMLVLVPQALATTQASSAGEASLTTQSSAANTTKERAYQLKSGIVRSGVFDYVTGSHSQLESYWYKFKTSKRDSMYILKAVSVDHDMICLGRFDKSGNKMEWDDGTVTFTGSQTNYKSDAPKDEWLYFQIDYQNSTDVGSRFKIKVTEYPLIKQITGVKLAKATSKSLKLKWKNQKNATKFQVKYRVKGGAWKTKNVKTNAITLKKLKKNTKYQVRVRAYCAKGYNDYDEKISSWGGWSETKTLKTTK